MECEMCGAKVATRRHRVEGNLMVLGACCERFGTLVEAPPTPKVVRPQAKREAKDVLVDEIRVVDDFAKLIRAGRERTGVTKENLGGKVHARVPELNKFESGALRPTLDQARALERELGIKLLETLAAEPTPTRKKTGGGGLTIGDILENAKGG